MRLRAGNKGTAITFIAPDEEQYSPDLVKALSESSAPIPQVGVGFGGVECVVTVVCVVLLAMLGFGPEAHSRLPPKQCRT